MTTASPRFEYYRTGGGMESMLIHGGSDMPRVLVIPALLEESNFLRKTLVDIARSLAVRRIASVIPDLPGAGDSLHPSAAATLDGWRQAASDAFDQSGCTHVAAFRGGALIDDALPARSWWRYAPVEGDTLVHALVRAARLSAGDLLSAYNPTILTDAVPIPPSGPCRTVPHEGSGAALWNRSEPGDDPDLVLRLTEDIIQWILSCDKP